MRLTKLSISFTEEIFLSQICRSATAVPSNRFLTQRFVKNVFHLSLNLLQPFHVCSIHLNISAFVKFGQLVATSYPINDFSPRFMTRFFSTRRQNQFLIFEYEISYQPYRKTFVSSANASNE
jgi:hypothetical protein